MATASWTSTWPTTRCSLSFTTTTATGRSPRVGLLAGVGFNEDGKTFAGMGVDFADYDNDGRPDIVVTDLSNERYKLFRQNGDGSFRDMTNASGVGGLTLPFSGLEHAVCRLRQRRLEGHLRRPGARDGHHREDVAESVVPAAAAADAERGRPFHASRAGRSVPGRSGRAAAPRSAIWTTTATSTSWSATSASTPSSCATTAATGGTGWRFRRVGTKSNRDGIGCLRESGLGFRVDAIVHRQHRCRISVGQRQADARRPGRRHHGCTGRDPMAFRRRPDVRERRGGRVLTATEPASSSARGDGGEVPRADSSGRSPSR